MQTILPSALPLLLRLKVFVIDVLVVVPQLGLHSGPFSSQLRHTSVFWYRLSPIEIHPLATTGIASYWNVCFEPEASAHIAFQASPIRQRTMAAAAPFSVSLVSLVSVKQRWAEDLK